MDEKQLIRAKNAAYRYLTFRPRSRAEIRKKLQDREFDDAVVDAVLVDLERLGYVNDRQFARDWARGRARTRGIGRRRIEQELKQKGIDRETIRETLAEIFAESSEADIARKEAEKKLKNLARFEPEVRRRRLAGFLERKGFPSDIIRTILRSAQ